MDIGLVLPRTICFRLDNEIDNTNGLAEKLKMAAEDPNGTIILLNTLHPSPHAMIGTIHRVSTKKKSGLRLVLVDPDRPNQVEPVEERTKTCRIKKKSKSSNPTFASPSRSQIKEM